jgi:hypothetical protein
MQGKYSNCEVNMQSNHKDTHSDSLSTRLAHEAKAIAIAALYFGCWLAVLVIIKKLILADYEIAFDGLSKALIGALVLSKVVLILEHVSLGAWVRAKSAWVDILLRTILYTLGVVIVLLMEKGFDGRHEYGGFIASLKSVFHHADIYHVWLNAIVISGALLVYNVLSVIRRHLGEGSIFSLLMQPVPNGSEVKEVAGTD